MKIRLLKQFGGALPGSVFVKGLHGVPPHETWKDKQPEQFFWEEGTQKTDNAFLYEKWLSEDDYEIIN